NAGLPCGFTIAILSIDNNSDLPIRSNRMRLAGGGFPSIARCGKKKERVNRPKGVGLIHIERYRSNNTVIEAPV
ncbi:hypothetical protein, partial [Rhizobium sp. AN95]|uniref:hypothetical protein n=1 Tax=Rhizobium sp. AN95 TaxID=3035216 RepID=UPI002B25BC0B